MYEKKNVAACSKLHSWSVECIKWGTKLERRGLGKDPVLWFYRPGFIVDASGVRASLNCAYRYEDLFRRFSPDTSGATLPQSAFS